MSPSSYVKSPMRRRGLRVAWAALALSTLLVLGLYEILPAELPLLRDLTSQWTTWASKTPLTALRVPAMGAGQLGAATVMLRAAERHRAGPWIAFWFAIVLIAGAKSVVETLQIASLGFGLPPAVDRVFFVAAVLPPIAGIAWAARYMWRARSDLTSVPLNGPDVFSLVASLALWLTAALVPFFWS